MRQKSHSNDLSSEEIVKGIRRATHANVTPPKRRSASCWTACAANTRSPSCAAAKALPRASTTAGPRSSSKPGDDVLKARIGHLCHNASSSSARTMPTSCLRSSRASRTNVPPSVLGPSHAATAGRMNARGISVFYGATDPKVALAEVRPPVGSFVVVGRFEIIKPLQLLDLTALSAVHIEGSIFDPNYASRLAKAKFLRSLTTRISRPVMPDDEAMDYLPTQAVADFLATRSDEPLDGIIFPSVQTGAGLNVVLFHKAACVGSLDMPAGSEVDVSLGHFNDEGWERDYSVFEKAPAAVPPPPAPSADFGLPVMPTISVAPTMPDRDFRVPPAMRTLPKSLQVHLIRAVTIQSEPHKVSRHRIEKQGSPGF